MSLEMNEPESRKCFSLDSSVVKRLSPLESEKQKSKVTFNFPQLAENSHLVPTYLINSDNIRTGRGQFYSPNVVIKQI